MSTKPEYKYIGKSLPGNDAAEKATGRLKYFSDMSLPGMLYGGILRSKYPHAKIISVNTEKAKRLPGVSAVLTAGDIPGLNAYGITIQDQPVLCQDKVRFIGDAVVAIAAENKEALEQALSAVEVEYEPLPLVTDLVSAMENRVILHEKTYTPLQNGNVFWNPVITKGDIIKGFTEADVVVESDYSTPWQLPGFLETESGVAAIDRENNITVWCGGQYPQREQKQIARALGCPPEKIRVFSSPVGGSFGGKEEMTVQIPLALLAYYTRRPVKIVLSREDSILSGWKRHPMQIHIKTGVKTDGSITASDITIYIDTGAYLSVGYGVAALAVEAAPGPYNIPNTRIKGYCIYTNNNIAGAVRGFGGPQVNFARECHLDVIAGKLKMDPLTFRRKNILFGNTVSPVNHLVEENLGMQEVLDRISQIPDYEERNTWKGKSGKSWLKRGVGLAVGIHCIGYGRKLNDISRARITLIPEGKFTVAVGCPDFGQGNTTAYRQIAAEVLSIEPGCINVVSGDSLLTPDSGATTASRTIYTGGNAIIAAAEKMLDHIKTAAAGAAGTGKNQVYCDNGFLFEKQSGRFIVSYRDLYNSLAEKNLNITEGEFYFPDAKAPYESYCYPHFIHSIIANIALVEVNTLTGEYRVKKVISVPAAGKIINPQGFEGQVEGGLSMGLGYAVSENVLIEKGMVLNKSLSTYIMPTAMDMPEMEIDPVENYEPTGPFGAKGIGEVSTIAVAPAVNNAIADAIGVYCVSLPVTAEKIYNLLHKNET